MSAVPDPVIDPIKLKEPDILLDPNPEWQETCRQRVAYIPSGYTYLTQLVGHDLGHSLDASRVPYVSRTFQVDGGETVRVNLITNPLTLETIYGPGPRLLGHLYDPRTLLFRLDPSARIARLLQPNTPGESVIRALYDERNRDTLMLHELTVAWMQFHNHCADRLLAQGAEPAKAYSDARMHVVQVWHDIIRNDVLPRYVHPDIAMMTELSDLWKLDEITLQHGLFRAFHAMPLEAYRLPLSGDHPLAALLKADHAPSMAEEEKWRVDWPRFFNFGLPVIDRSEALTKEVPLTGLAASGAAMLDVGRLDFSTAKESGPLTMKSPKITQAVDALPPDLAAQCRPEQLAEDFAAKFRPKSVPSGHVLENGPLYLALLVEAQLYGKNGGFGPFGSALFRASILGAIHRVQGPTVKIGLPKPETMLELIQLDKTRREHAR